MFRLVPTGRQSAQGGTFASLSAVRRLDSLFRAMATDYLLREQFVTGPSAVIYDFVHGEQLSPEQAQVSDQLIYAVMSNRRLLEWLYERVSNTDGELSRDQFAYQFAQGVADHGGRHVIVALMKASASAQHPVALDEVLMPILSRRLRQLDDGDGDGGTGTGDGGTGTGDGGTGTGAPDGGTGTGTGDGGTGTGTGDGGTGTGSPDGGTGGTLTAITFSTYITTGDGGTGTGTTPFTHTAMTRSPFTTHTTADLEGRGGDVFDPSYVVVTLDALFQYANQLREQGALDYAFSG